jgi:homoserine kinase type II
LAVLTPVDAAEARALGGRFGVRVRSSRAIPQGSVNTNVELIAEGGERYFLRVFEEQTAETAAHEARILERLAASGVPTPRPLPLSAGGGALAEHRGKPVAVFPFLEGEVLCQKRVTAAHARAVGGALAKLHAAGASLLSSPDGALVGETRFSADALLDRLSAAAEQTLIEEVERAVLALAHALAARAAAPVERGPIGFVHGDLFRDNVLFLGERLVALLDFESASRGPLAYDLAVTVLAWCFGAELDLELGAALVGGYQAVRPLEPEARAAFFEEALFAGARFATTRITDFELRAAGAGVYKDFRRWLARDAALRRLGPAEVGRALFG